MKLSLKMCIGTAITALVLPILSKSLIILAQPGLNSAVIFAPPSNIRATPNGNIICSIKKVTTIQVSTYTNEWYETYVCGTRGYIHKSQIRLQNSYQQPSSHPQ
jgi:serine/threonine-protein kinase